MRGVGWAILLLVGCGGEQRARSPNTAADDAGSSTASASTASASTIGQAAVAARAGHAAGAHVPPGLSHGVCRSPIDIRTTQAGEGMHDFQVHWGPSHEKVVNKGHTIEVDYDPGSSVSFDGREFDLAQFHFHTPSEHLIDGIRYPMEMHVVHTRREAEGYSGPPHYLVVAAMFREGERNAFLDEFLSDIPKTAHKMNLPRAKVVDLRDLLPQGLSGYYSYRGSLTTAPFTETVNWILLKKEIRATPQQIDVIHKLEGDNAREVQNAEGRTPDSN